MAKLETAREVSRTILGKLDVFMKVIPAKDRDNPHALASWLRAASQLGGLRPIERQAITDAQIAVGEWGKAAKQQDELAALYYHPQVQAAAKALGHDVDWFWQRPAEAAKELTRIKFDQPGLLPRDLLERATDAAFEAREHNREAGITEPDALGNVPSAYQREIEIKQLTEKSITGKLTETESRRYDQLLGARLAEQQAAEDKAFANYKAGLRGDTNTKAPSSAEIDALTQKSIRGKLTPEEDQRYNRLLEAREIAAGRMEPPPTADAEHYEIDHELADLGQASESE